MKKACLFLFPYRENAGLLALTRVGSRRVVQISAGFMIFFSILGELKLESLSATSFIT
jgi:nucleobase transporter 1/2